VCFTNGSVCQLTLTTLNLHLLKQDQLSLSMNWFDFSLLAALVPLFYIIIDLISHPLSTLLLYHSSLIKLINYVYYYVLVSLRRGWTRSRSPSGQCRSRRSGQPRGSRRHQSYGQRCSATHSCTSSRKTSSCMKLPTKYEGLIKGLYRYLFRVGCLEGLSCLVHGEISHLVFHEAQFNCRFSKTHIYLIQIKL